MMIRGVLLAIFLAIFSLGAAGAAAQVPLHVATEEEDRPFHLVLSDSAGVRTECTVPSEPPCQLTPTAGPLKLSLTTGTERFDALLTVPPEGADLKLTHHTTLMGWIGLAMIAESLVDTGVAISLGVAAHNATSNSFTTDPFNSRPLLTADAVVFGVLAGGVMIAGAIVAALGFHKAGPHADLVPLTPQGPAPGTQAPPPISEAPPPAP